MAAWKPAYLIHGDDHGRIAERRAAAARARRGRERARGRRGLRGRRVDARGPSRLALSAMTFAMGRRFLVVDGVERWKDAEVEAHLVPALADIAPDTTVAFFAREEGRAKAPAKLAAP